MALNLSSEAESGGAGYGDPDNNTDGYDYGLRAGNKRAVIRALCLHELECT
jgi:hypothetical protein